MTKEADGRSGAGREMGDGGRAALHLFPVYFFFLSRIKTAMPVTMAIAMAGRHHGLPPDEMPGSGFLTVKSTEAVSEVRLAAKAFASI